MPITITNTDIVFQTGRSAKLRAIDRQACPYPSWFGHAKRWLAGWDSVVVDTATVACDTIPSHLQDRFDRMAEAGLPAVEIARQLNLTIGRILLGLGGERWKRRRLVWTKVDKWWRENERLHLDSRWSSGTDVAVICRELGRRKSDIVKRLEYMERPSWVLKERTLLRSLLLQGQSVPEIAARLDRTSRAVEAQVDLITKCAELAIGVVIPAKMSFSSNSPDALATAECQVMPRL